MAIDKNADFTPSIPDSDVVPTKLPYNTRGGFKFWAQKVIPLVYNDSLSYYEVLCKVVNYLNNVIQNVDNLNESVNSTNQSFETLKEYVNTTKDTLINTYNELQDYVNTYFDNLDVQEEINAKLDAMADSGELTNLLAPFIPDLVTQWLNNHVTPTSPVVDNTLSISGAAADAKVTGDNFTELKSALTEDTNASYGMVFTASKDSDAGLLKQYHFIPDHTYLFTNTSDSADVQAYTRNAPNANAEVIKNGINPGESVEFRPTIEAIYVYAYGNAAFSFSIIDITSPGYRLDTNAFTARTLLTSNDDLNNILTNGAYYYSSSSVPSHNPAGGGEVLVYTSEDKQKYITQLYFNPSVIYYRYKSSSGWNDWTEIATSTYISNNAFSTKTTLTSADNLNNLSSPGTYKYNTSSIPENAPANNGGIINVFRSIGGEFITQVYNNKNSVFVRMKTSTGWGEWLGFANPSEIKTVVSSTNIKRIPSQFDVIAADGYYVHDFANAGYEHKSDDTTVLRNDFSPILDCPEYLAFVIPLNYRLEIYIGDIVSDEFVLDENYIITTDGNNVINILTPADSCAIRTDGTKKYYYRFFTPYPGTAGDLLMIGCNNWPKAETLQYLYSWQIRADDDPGAGGLSNTAGNSIVLPTNCFFAARPKENGWMKLFKSNKSNAGPYYFSKREALPIGFIPDNITYALLFPADDTKTVYDIDVYTDIRLLSGATGAAAISEELSEKTTKFMWEAVAPIEWAGATSNYVVGKKYPGIPYSSRWKDAHFIGFEVSPETALNAANDSLSIWYDKTDVRAAVPLGYGPGYGHVCSSYASLIAGSDYPQTNKYYSFDTNFEIQKSEQVMPGCIYSNIYDEKGNGANTHCVYNLELINGGYTIIEATLPFARASRHTYHNKHTTAGQLGENSMVDYNYLNEYGWNVSLRHRYGFDAGRHTYTDFEGITIANGNVRPWRGNKAVYGPWDKSESGCGIWITVHGATKAYLKKPDETVVEYTVQDGDVVDIASDVTQDGTYELYGNVNSDVKEYFRYRTHEDVTLHIEDDGTATFSSADVDYCYVYGDSGFGKNLEYLGTHVSVGDVVANTAKYKAAKYPGINPDGCYAAMVYDEWGRYAVPCTLI